MSSFNELSEVEDFMSGDSTGELQEIETAAHEVTEAEKLHFGIFTGMSQIPETRESMNKVRTV